MTLPEKNQTFASPSDKVEKEKPQNAQYLSNRALLTIIREKAEAADSWHSSLLADDQENAIDFYEARPFGDEEEGRSQVVSPDVAEVVDYMTVSLLRTIISGDRVVEFEPASLEQAQAAEDATEAISYAFMHGQDGYKVLHDWIQSGLIEKIGIVKTAVLSERRAAIRHITLEEDALAALLMEAEDDPDLQLSVTDRGTNGFYDVTITRYRQQKRYIDMPIPSEEYRFSARTRHEDDADYQAHVSYKTLSDLIEMGFDPNIIETLPYDKGRFDSDPRANARWRDENPSLSAAEGVNREVLLHEEYVKLDRDGDGIAELLQIFRVQDTLLAIEEVDEAPFVIWTPFPRAHRMVGNSLAEKVMDIQRIKSVLMRQALDGVYQTNAPRMAVNIDGLTEDTFDDLLTVRPGAIVRYRGSIPPTPLNEGFDIQKSLGMMEYMQAAQESRTGITRLNQGLDADTLNKTATGQALLQAQGQQIEEYVARNFAQSLGRLFQKKLWLMIADGDPIAIKVEGLYRTVDPTLWPPDMAIRVTVGLGSGRKDQRLAYRQQLLNVQQQALALGLTGPEQIYNNIAAMIRDCGLGIPTDYLIDPATLRQNTSSQNKTQNSAGTVVNNTDDRALKAEQESDLTQQKAMAEQNQIAAEFALKKQEAEAKLVMQQQEHAQRLALAKAKAAEDAELARQRSQFEASLAKETADRNYEMALKMAEQKKGKPSRKIDQWLPQDKSGGALDK
ncbi:MAG: hypothetical protein ABF461_04345 [Zymomonas mobilis subsp. pomaceae]|uniref:portal protein n=1 Tax=Zymomonas mobilis TaxID=542 RepID=UPI0039ED84A3